MSLIGIADVNMTIPKRFNITAQDSYNYLASKEFADQQLCMILKLSGRVDENLFVKAMLLSLDQEPILAPDSFWIVAVHFGNARMM